MNCCIIAAAIIYAKEEPYLLYKELLIESISDQPHCKVGTSKSYQLSTNQHTL